jgi:hypothetical protein
MSGIDNSYKIDGDVLLVIHASIPLTAAAAVDVVVVGGVVVVVVRRLQQPPPAATAEQLLLHSQAQISLGHPVFHSNLAARHWFNQGQKFDPMVNSSTDSTSSLEHH